MKWFIRNGVEKKRADLERLAELIQEEYQLAQMEADVLERRLDPDEQLAQSAVRLRDAFSIWYENYRDVLAAYDEFETEKARCEARKRSVVLSSSA
jgi:hypothetical protein